MIKNASLPTRPFIPINLNTTPLTLSIPSTWIPFTLIVIIAFDHRLKDIIPWNFFEFASLSFNQFNLNCCHWILEFNWHKESKLDDKECISSNSSFYTNQLYLNKKLYLFSIYLFSHSYSPTFFFSFSLHNQTHDTFFYAFEKIIFI